MKNNIVSIDAVISRIEINGYIDCTEFGGYMEDYEYDNIIYYLKKYKDLQNRIDKAIEYIKYAEENKQLKDNWNKLKEYAKEIISTDNELYGTDLLDKMQEIEQGSDSNE